MFWCHQSFVPRFMYFNKSFNCFQNNIVVKTTAMKKNVLVLLIGCHITARFLLKFTDVSYQGIMVAGYVTT